MFIIYCGDNQNFREQARIFNDFRTRIYVSTNRTSKTAVFRVFENRLLELIKLSVNLEPQWLASIKPQFVTELNYIKQLADELGMLVSNEIAAQIRRFVWTFSDHLFGAAQGVGQFAQHQATEVTKGFVDTAFVAPVQAVLHPIATAQSFVESIRLAYNYPVQVLAGTVIGIYNRPAYFVGSRIGGEFRSSVVSDLLSDKSASQTAASESPLKAKAKLSTLDKASMMGSTSAPTTKPSQGGAGASSIPKSSISGEIFMKAATAVETALHSSTTESKQMTPMKSDEDDLLKFVRALDGEPNNKEDDLVSFAAKLG